MTKLEIEQRSGSCLVEPVVLVGCAAAEPGSLGSQDFVLRITAGVATSVAASGIDRDSCLAYWCSLVRRVAPPPATSIRPPAGPGNDRDFPNTASLPVHLWIKVD